MLKNGKVKSQSTTFSFQSLMQHLINLLTGSTMFLKNTQSTNSLLQVDIFFAKHYFLFQENGVKVMN